jgi:hypothetical protein
MLMSAMNDPHREVVIRVRLNQAEIDALAKLAAAKGIGVNETLRRFIHKEAAPK